MASVIASRNRYQDDASFRTETLVISLLFVLSATTMVLTVTVFANISKSLQELQEAMFTSPDALNVMASIQNTRAWNIALLVFAILIADLIFGYLIAYVALKPTRTALRSQKQFIRNIAHELRTPLSIIKTNSEIALLDPEMRPQTRDIFHSHIEELDRISDILNNTLTLSALERPERMRFSCIDLADVVRTVTERHAMLSEECGVRVTVRPGSSAYVWGNQAALEQIVSSVLKNAIIYTSNKGAVKVAMTASSRGTVELQMRDSGIGMTRAQIERVFEPFYRADPSRTRSRGGSGIGLTIAYELVKMHRGTIRMESEEGRGTTVTINLPGAPKSGIPAKVSSSYRDAQYQLVEARG